MESQRGKQRLRVFGSLRWRIGLSFVLFVLLVVGAQTVFFSYQLWRDVDRDPARSLNTRALIIAADMGALLSSGADIDLEPAVRSRYGQGPPPIFVVLKSGEVVGSTPAPLEGEVLQAARLLLAGQPPRPGEQPRLPRPVVIAPIQVAGRLQGLVVLPRPPWHIEVFNELARVLSVPGTLILIAGTVLSTWVIFRPASRRLRLLQQAAVRVQRGDLSARVAVEGSDEISEVANAFNRMGDDLAARDQALRAADRTRRQMLADVSHELKTPLTTIRGYIETLQMGNVDDDRDRRFRYLDTVMAETHRLEKIVADLLDLAHHENRVGALDARVFAIERVFHEVARRRESEAHARHIALRIHVEERADQVVADPDRIDQAIDNLVVNALRYVPDGGSIELRAMRGPRVVSLLVIDSGPGIPPEHLDHVFDRFYKVDTARVAANAGSGLGLSIVKAIVDRHDGAVSVTSRPGRTEFKIVLPQADQAVARH
jgi:signal transduction histidine kinase